MATVSSSYANNETKIFNYLTSTMGLNYAAACGVMANLYAESGFNPKNLQNSYESSLGYTDIEYTDAVDKSKYKNFVSDSAGYGIAQWTYYSRKQNLLNYSKKRGTSIGDLSMQLDFLRSEMLTYSSLMSILKSAENSEQGAYESGYAFCYEFERPADIRVRSNERGNSAMNTFFPLYKNGSSETVKAVENIGQKVVDRARDHVGDPYEKGKSGPGSFDAPGLVYYSYLVHYNIMKLSSAQDYYDYYKDSKKAVSGTYAAGDLLFYSASGSDAGINHIAIATGTGGMIHAKAENFAVIEESTTGSPSHALRLLSDSETNATTSTEEESGSAIAEVETYAEEITYNLERVAEAGYDYGYLIDLTNGGEFKFYIPEFSEEAGANWENISITGRSVDIKAYKSTSSRVVSISLDLYAGAGLYAGTASDEFQKSIDALHQDANFIKSLEYPDYTNPIVRPPATVQLILGSAVHIVGVVSKVNVQHMKPFDDQNRAMYIRVSFTVTQTAVNPIDWTDVRGGEYVLTSTADISSLLADTTTDDIYYTEEENNTVAAASVTSELSANTILVNAASSLVSRDVVISESEFNKSSAMQDKYGSYAQYIKYKIGAVDEGEFNENTTTMLATYGSYSKYIQQMVNNAQSGTALISKTATNLVDEGKLISESEFNRSSSMQSQYGSYSNYIRTKLGVEKTEDEFNNDTVLKNAFGTYYEFVRMRIQYNSKV